MIIICLICDVIGKPRVVFLFLRERQWSLVLLLDQVRNGAGPSPVIRGFFSSRSYFSISSGLVPVLACGSHPFPARCDWITWSGETKGSLRVPIPRQSRNVILRCKGHVHIRRWQQEGESCRDLCACTCCHGNQVYSSVCSYLKKAKVASPVDYFYATSALAAIKGCDVSELLLFLGDDLVNFTGQWVLNFALHLAQISIKLCVLLK